MSIEQIKQFVSRGAAAQRAVDKVVAALNVLTVKRKWGAHPPAWVLALAEACDASSQGKIAARLGVSATVVNQALQNVYAGRLDRFEQRVRGELMRETVGCPVLGVITKRECLDHQSRPYEATNPMRVRLFQACPRCPNRREP
jgi:DNA-binding transcriptional regulator YdaS (Cro superfamily)